MADRGLRKLRLPRELVAAAHEWRLSKRPWDRDAASKRTPREFLEALWNLAYYDTDKRRRRERRPKVSIFSVAIWCQAYQARLRAAYKRHTRHIRDPRDMPPRTLTRKVNAAKRRHLIRVIQPRYFDKRLGKWVADANVYAFTYRGKLWIKRNARAITNQLVV